MLKRTADIRFNFFQFHTIISTIATANAVSEDQLQTAIYKMGQYISFLFTNNKVYFPLGVCCWTDPPLSDNLLLSYSWTFLITDYLTGGPGSDCSFFQFLVYHVVLFGIIMSDMKIHEYSWFVMERIKTGFIISPHCSFSIFLMISIIDQFSVKLTPDNKIWLCGIVDTARPM